MSAPRFDLGDAVRVMLPAFPSEVDLLPGDVRAMYDGQVGWIADRQWIAGRLPRLDLVRVAFDDEHLASGLWPPAELARICETCRAELRDDDGESWPYCPSCRYDAVPWAGRWHVVERPQHRLVRAFDSQLVAERVALYLNRRLTPVEA